MTAQENIYVRVVDLAKLCTWQYSQALRLHWRTINTTRQDGDRTYCRLHLVHDVAAVVLRVGRPPGA